MPEEAVVIEEELQVEETDIEDVAASMGWKPEEDWSGEGVWVGAEEFVARKPLFDAISKANRKADRNQKVIDELVAHNKKVESAAYEKARKELKTAKIEAMEAADYKAVTDIEEQEKQLETQEQEAATQEVSAVFTSWMEENDWYQTDEDLTIYAEGYGQRLRTQNPNMDEAEFFNKVTEKVKEQYPAKFGVKRIPNGGHDKSVKGKSGKKGGISFNQLTDEQKEVARTFEKSGLMTVDAYLKQLELVEEEGV